MSTIIITGSTDGIGKLTAEKLAKEGHHVLLHGRNPEKVGRTVQWLQEKTANKNIEGIIADLSDRNRITTVIQEIRSRFSTIDVLINNAGVFTSGTSTSKDGLDLRFAVNYVAPYILTKGLLPLLEKSGIGRIINLSSAAQSPISLPALRGEEQITVQASYAQSKLALTMWGFQLAKTLKNSTVIAVNPGSLLNTKMVKEAYGHHWSSADKGANILYDLAISSEFEGVTGLYWDNDKGEARGEFSEAHPDAYDQEKIDALLNTTEEILSR